MEQLALSHQTQVVATSSQNCRNRFGFGEDGDASRPFVANDNACFRVVMSLLDLCHRLFVNVIIEQPVPCLASSFCALAKHSATEMASGMFAHSKMKEIVSRLGLEQTTLELDVFGAPCQKRLQLCWTQRGVTCMVKSQELWFKYGFILILLRWSNWVYAPILRQFCQQGKEALVVHGHWDSRPKRGMAAASVCGPCLPAEGCGTTHTKQSQVYPTGFGIAVSAALLIPPWQSALPDVACLQHYVHNIMPATLEGWCAPSRNLMCRALWPVCLCHSLPDCNDTEEEHDEGAEALLSPKTGLPSPASPAVDGPVQGLLCDFFFGDMDPVGNQSGHCPSPYPDMVSCHSPDGGDSESDSASQGDPSDQLRSTCGCLDPDCPGMLGWTPPSPYSDAPTWVLGACPARQLPSMAAHAAITSDVDTRQQLDTRKFAACHDDLMRESTPEETSPKRPRRPAVICSACAFGSLHCCWQLGSIVFAVFSLLLRVSLLFSRVLLPADVRHVL